MTSTAISAQGSKLYVGGTPGAAISITGISKAPAAVVTATNTTNVGDSVTFGAVTGMPEILGLIGTVTAASGTAFTVNINTSAFANPGTTGTATPQAYTKINNFKSYAGFDGSATELDFTNQDSVAMENGPGLQDFGQFSFDIQVDNMDAGQLALRAAKTAATTLPYRLVLPNGKVRSWQGWVKKFSETGGVNAVLNASVDVRITGPVIYS